MQITHLGERCWAVCTILSFFTGATFDRTLSQDVVVGRGEYTLDKNPFQRRDDSEFRIYESTVQENG